MKKLVTIIFMLILVSTTVLADVMYPDLLIHVIDNRGNYTKTKDGEYIYEEHWATTDIAKASKIGLIDGYEDGTFKPDNEITRAEFIKMAMMLSTNRTFDFSIMPSCGVTGWSGPYVSAAEIQRVIEKGKYTDANINEPITRIEMICILSKIQINMKGISQYRESDISFYTDIDSLTNEEKEMLLHAARYELIDGMLETTEIKPDSKLTRAEAAVAIMRIY